MVDKCDGCGRAMRKRRANTHVFEQRYCSTNAACVRKQSAQQRSIAPWHTRRSVAARLLDAAKKRAKQKGVPFALTANDIVVPEVCPVLGIPLFIGKNRGPKKHSPTLDRIRPALGYVPGNVTVISGYANWIKADATSQEVQKVAEWMRQQGV